MAFTEHFRLNENAMLSTIIASSGLGEGCGYADNDKHRGHQNNRKAAKYCVSELHLEKLPGSSIAVFLVSRFQYASG